MVFQGKINVSLAEQFTVTVTRTLIVKSDGICKYVNSDDSCIYNKHARAQNNARSFVNETVKMEPLDQKLRKHLLLKMIQNS